MSIRLETLFEDEALVVVNKPSGCLSEGGGEREADVEQIVSGQSGRAVFCCHRLDRLTSGVLALRKGKRYTRELAEQFEGRLTRKQYWILAEGIWPKGLNRIETRIDRVSGGRWGNVDTGGKVAVSSFRLLGVDAGRETSWVSALLKTGRTHQLRLHAVEAGCPVLGDPLYGNRREDGLFGLHARSLSMRHPATGEALQFEAAAPEAWREWLERLG